MFVKKSDRYVSVEEAADRLGKSVGQINLYIWLHLIPNVEQVGKYYIIPIEEVFKLEEKNRFNSEEFLSSKQDAALYN